MNKIIIELLIVVILIASIAITLNLNNQTTPIANNTTETTVDSVTEESQEQPYSARFENDQYQYNHQQTHTQKMVQVATYRVMELENG